jgi:phage tail-like protein
VPPQASQRRGAAADAQGTVYAITEAGLAIEVRSAGSGRISRFWPPEDSSESASPPAGDFAPTHPAPVVVPSELSGLVVTHDQHLVAALPDTGLIVFDLLAGGPPMTLSWPDGWSLQATDMAPRCGGGVAILDASRRRVWLLDRRLRMSASVPISTEPASDFTWPPGFEPPTDHAATPPTARPWFDLQPVGAAGAEQAPIAIEVMPDGSILILDEADADGFAVVHRYVEGTHAGRATTRSMIGVFPPADAEGFTWPAFDFAWHAPASDSRAAPPRLVIVSQEGNQGVLFEVLLQSPASGEPLRLAAQADYLPLKRYVGMPLVSLGRSLVEGDTGLLYRSLTHWLPLVAQRRPRHQSEATLVTPVYDAKEPGHTWHRVMLDACVPTGCRLVLASRCSDDLELLDSLPFTEEPQPVLRPDGSELPWLLDAPGSRTDAAKGLGTWETLLQRCRGRWVQLSLRLEGNELTTPRVAALRLWRPRFSYLDRYLPAVYREDESSADFLERFLALFEGSFTTLEDRIATASALFDVRTAPAETLDWLASWLGLVLDPALDEPRRRQLIDHASALFQYRGTPQAVRLATQLAVATSVLPESEFELPRPSQAQPWGVRVLESFLTRSQAPALLGRTVVSDQPRVLSSEARWSLKDGAAGLQQRWRDWLAAQTPSDAGAKLLDSPAFGPICPAEVPRGIWQGFCEAQLGAVPTLAAALDQAWQERMQRQPDARLPDRLPQRWPEPEQAEDPANALALQEAWRTFIAKLPPRLSRHLRRWQAFVARRHHGIATWRARTGGQAGNWPSFALMAPPTALPTDPVSLTDWALFETRLEPMQARAHTFSVLLPISGPGSDIATLQRDMDLVRRVVSLEKPAHTRFDIQPYWTLFRLGQVRLGLDTLLGEGSRDPQLAPSMVLGQGHIGASRTASRRDVPPDRILLEC